MDSLFSSNFNSTSWETQVLTSHFINGFFKKLCCMIKSGLYCQGIDVRLFFFLQ